MGSWLRTAELTWRRCEEVGEQAALCLQAYA